MTRSVLLAALAALPLAASCAPGPPPEASIVWGGAGASTPPRLPRPPLPLGADSNSAEAYTTHGRAWLNRAPDTAAAAFEWALKLDPEYAYAYHGRAVAMLIAYAEPTPRAIPAWRFRASVPVERLRYVDSLNMHALLLDPFFEPQFEYLFMGGLQFPSYHTVKDPAMAG